MMSFPAPLIASYPRSSNVIYITPIRFQTYHHYMGSGKAAPSWKVKRMRSGRLDISRPANTIPSSSQSNVKNALSRILLKLRHLDLSEHVVEKSSAKDAHGGCCDVFVGHIAHEHLPPHFTARTGLGEGRVKVAIKTLRVRLNEETKIAKVRNVTIL